MNENTEALAPLSEAELDRIERVPEPSRWPGRLGIALFEGRVHRFQRGIGQPPNAGQASAIVLRTCGEAAEDDALAQFERAQRMRWWALAATVLAAIKWLPAWFSVPKNLTAAGAASPRSVARRTQRAATPNRTAPPHSLSTGPAVMRAANVRFRFPEEQTARDFAKAAIANAARWGLTGVHGKGPLVAVTCQARCSAAVIQAARASGAVVVNRSAS